ncbi:PaaI family thioesterase [Nocardia fluminea]|uniref:PaaI family thioesterase n=1 Tax=Nocardia TaxID=1817 RepID=UPI0009038B09|nr:MULTISPECIES: PaaI family thioesterase [Nocardia]
MSNLSDTGGRSSDPDLEEWVRSFRLLEPRSAELPPHHPNCLGCGPANPHGHFLTAQRCAGGVVAHHRFDRRHVGAPGIAHGGAVATVVDDLFGFLLYTVGELAVTRHLDLDYLAPVQLDTPYALHAELRSRDGRKLHLGARIEDAGGHLVVTATALFIVVDVKHFLQSPVSARRQA